MNEEHFRTDEHLQELRRIRHDIRRASYIIAGGLVLAALIVAGFFAPGGEIVWTCMVIGGMIWALVVVVGSTIGSMSKRRVAARIDRERRAALSGRTSNLSPINK